jgi:hypothetical protein
MEISLPSDMENTQKITEGEKAKQAFSLIRILRILLKAEYFHLM